MPKAKISESARVVEYFRYAPLDLAEEILGIVKETVKKRKPSPGPRRGKLHPARQHEPVPATVNAGSQS